MIHFRTSPRTTDVAAIRRVVTDTGVFSGIEIGWAAEIIETALANPEQVSYNFLFAESGQELLGYTCFGPIEGTDNRFDLYWIAVSPRAQGKRVGAQLLEMTIESAKHHGATHLFIDTSTRKDYAPAHALYRSQGFELMGSLTDFYSDGDGKAIFGRRL